MANNKEPINPDRVRFKARVMALARSHFGGSCESDDASVFLDEVADEYSAAGSPGDRDPWIKARLSGCFASVQDPPEWVDEPDWPFFDGQPMVFIAQHRIPKTKVSESTLTWDEVIYIFGCRVPHSRGYTVEYRIVTQILGMQGTGYE